MENKVVKMSDFQSQRDHQWYLAKTAIGFLEDAIRNLSRKSEFQEVREALDALNRSKMLLERRVTTEFRVRT